MFKHTDAAVESDSRVAEVGSALGVFISLKPTPVYLSRPPVFISVQSKMPKLFFLQLKVPYYAELALTSEETKDGGRNVSVAPRDEK